MTTSEQPVQEYEPTAAEKFASMFEQNEAGQWEIAKRPELPKLSWSDVDPVEIEQWYQGKVDLETAQGQKWSDAWIAYMDAVAEPWNSFVDEAEGLALEDKKLELDTDEEVIRYLADNTFVDGVSLMDTYPEIEDWITEMKAEAIKPEFYDWDIIKVPENGQIEMPTEEPAPVVMQAEAESYGQTAWTEEEMEKQQMWNDAVEEMKNKAISYGYDRDVAEEWFTTAGADWEDLTMAHDKAEMELGQRQVREASDYVKGIFDNMVIDLKQQQVQDMETFSTNVDDFVSQLKTEIDTHQKENIQKFEDWFNSKYDKVQESTNYTYDEVVDMATPEPAVEETAVYLASKGAAATEGVNPAVIGYSILGMGVMLAGARFIYKKSQVKRGTVDKSSLLGDEQV